MVIMGLMGLNLRTQELLLPDLGMNLQDLRGMTAAPPAFWALEEKCMMCFLSIQLVQFFHQWWQFGAPENPQNSMANGSYTGEVAEGSNGPSQVSSSASLRSTRSVACHNRTRTNRKKGISFVVSSLKFHTTESQRKS